MKKLLILFSIICGFNSFGSHILGGHVQVSYYSVDSVEITTTLTTHSGGISPNYIYLDEYKTNSVGYYQWKGSIQSSKDSTYSFQGYLVTIYKAKRSIYCGNYRWVYENCCRGVITNSTSSFTSSFTIGTDYQKDTLVQNSSPLLLNQLPVEWVLNDTSNSIMFIIDTDGDSVVIEKDDAINQYSTTGTFVPITSFTQLDNTSYAHGGLYSVMGNGIITWAPKLSGWFVTGYKVNEYRNGSLIGTTRIQQTYKTVIGSSPNMVSPFIQLTYDLVNGDSTEISISYSNVTSSTLYIPGVNSTQISNSKWSLKNLQSGNYRAVIRLTNSSFSNDYQFSLKVLSTMGIKEDIVYRDTQYSVYDWNGRYMGDNINWAELKGLYVIRYNNGKVEKVFCN